jgi:hypothetical protein
MKDIFGLIFTMVGLSIASFGYKLLSGKMKEKFISQMKSGIEKFLQ